MKFNTEYFNNNTYFFLKDRGDTISLYYTSADTLSESRKKDKKRDFNKKDEEKIKKIMSKHLKNKTTEKDIEEDLDFIDGEIEEIVGDDGGMLNSRIPKLNQRTHPKKTMDQTVPASRITNDPLTRGYRTFYGEGVVKEIDMSDAFGYDETEYMDYDKTVETLIDMGVDNAEERAKEFGKLPKSKIKNGKLKQRLSEKEKIEEHKKKSLKIIEDILTKKTKDNSDVLPNKENGISKILKKNLENIKNIAEKEGISISDLIKILKK